MDILTSGRHSKGLPIGDEYYVTLTGQSDKCVVCESCQHEYYYRLERSVSGSGFSFLFLDDNGAQRRAESRAAKKLDLALTTRSELVPCPNCGHYQKDMVHLARAKYFSTLRKLMRYLIVGTMLYLMGTLAFVIFNEFKPIPEWAVMGPVGLIGACFLLGPLCWLVARMSDPNDEPQPVRLDVAAAGLRKFPSPLYVPSQRQFFAGRNYEEQGRSSQERG